MTCHNCQIEMKKFGCYGKTKIQRYRCSQCKKTFSEPQQKPLEDMRIPTEKAVQAIHCLVEGCSIRSTERLTGLEKKTILRLLRLVGRKCEDLMNTRLQGLDCKLIQADEIWGFVRKKEKRIRYTDPKEYGDQYTFVALDAETKLVICFEVGKRDGITTGRFIKKLQGRLNGCRPQFVTDAFRPYIEAVENTFGADIDYAQLIKVYGGNIEPGRERYSPSRIVGKYGSIIQGNPDKTLVCTSHVERQNLTMRMAIRRLTRLTNGFSKKLVNLRAAVALYFAYYNFCRIHSTLRVTPAMEAGITDCVWSIKELFKEEKYERA